jgi:predicted RNase H-like nuclease (RuvC/YqgF family)
VSIGGWPSPSGWRLVRWLLVLAVFALLWCGWPRQAHAAEWSDSNETALSSPLPTPTEHARNLIEWSRSLVERLTTRTGEVTSLRSEVERWRSEASALSAELETLRPLSAEVARLSLELQTALREISRLQTESARKQSAYSSALAAERVASQAVLDTVTKSRDAWRVIAIVLAVIAAGAGTLAAVR